MTHPGKGPGFARRAACAAVVVGLLAAGGAIGAAVTTGPRRPAASASTTTTTSPWVPGVGGTVTVGIDQAPTGCNPNTASGDTWADRLLLQPVLPSAFSINSDGQTTYDPALITQAELQSTNPQTVVYTINPRAVWSDGKPVTAADFLYTWRQERGTAGPVGALPATGSGATSSGAGGSVSGGTGTGSGGSGGSVATPPIAVAPTPAGSTGVVQTTTLPGATGTTGPQFGYRQISSMTPSAKGRTVTVVFKTHYADWQSLFDYLLPAHVLEKTGWNPPCTTLDPSIDLSAGPYVLRKVVPGKEVVLVRNPRWWEPTQPLAKIVVMIASGPSELSQWLSTGKVDVALPIGYDQQYLQTVTSQPGLASQSQLSTTLLQLEFSTTAPYAASLDIRLAVAHAIDRQSLVNTLVGWADSTIVPAASHLYAQSQQGYPSHKPPPLQVSGQPGYTPTGAKSSPTATAFPSRADLAETARLLTAAGATRLGNGPWTFLTGTALDLRMAVDTADPWADQAAAALSRQLGAAGIGVTLIDEPSAEAAGLQLAQDMASMALLPMHSSAYPSQAIAWYTPLLGPPGTGGSQDWSNFDDTAVNGLLEKASQQLNPVDAAPLYAQVDAALWQQMVALPLFAQPSILAWSGLVAGVSANPNGPSLLSSVQSWALRVPPNSPKAQS
ncbi:MAG: ABC transporter substrate-binding protein [Actinomycetota bacterium]|nr:ABC transporter substrate-binding protein [Actinomycetota bacterium]